MIKHKEVIFDYPLVEVWFKNIYLFSVRNPVEFNKVRVLIVQRNLNPKDYWFKFGESKIELNEWADLENYPKGMYDQDEETLQVLINHRIKNIKKQ